MLTQGLHRRIACRTTPHGPILARIPVLHLNGQAFGDLSWYQGEARLLLVLTKCNRPTHLPYPIYDIGVYNASVTYRTPPLRLVKILNFQDNVSAMRRNSRNPLRTILLVRHRPRKNPEVPIHLPLNHSFPPSIRLPEHLFRSLLSRPTMTEVSIANTQLPWSGDPPFITAFRVETQAQVLYATVLIGLCTSRSTNGKDTGSLWATFRGSQSRWEHTDYTHQCTADHVLNWPGLRRRFAVRSHADDKGIMSKWMFNMEFTLSVHTEILVLTHIDCRRRVLLRGSGYHDFLEELEEEERMKQTHVDEESPTSTRDGETNGASHAALEGGPQEATGCCPNRLCPVSLFDRLALACACSMGLFVHQVRSYPSSISVFHPWASLFLSLHDQLGDRNSLPFMSPAISHWSGVGSADLSMLLP